jgi:hypothetical protein
MHEATAVTRAEGTVSKRRRSLYRPGRSRHSLKAKHKITEVVTVAGWRPSTASPPGGLILVEDGQFTGVTLALPETQRRALVSLIERHGRGHPSGAVTIPEDVLKATVHLHLPDPDSRAPAGGRRGGRAPCRWLVRGLNPHTPPGLPVLLARPGLVPAPVPSSVSPSPDHRLSALLGLTT